MNIRNNVSRVLLVPDSDALGGAAAPTAPVAAAPVAASAAPATGEKRVYTPRGKTVLSYRVVLRDGKKAGVGRPKADAVSGRTVVYVPKGMKYNPEIHGKGVRYTGQNQPAAKRLVIDKLGYTLPKSVKVAKMKGFKVLSIKAAKKTAKKGGTKAPKKSSVTVPVTPAPAPEAPVTAPVSETTPVAA
jgi:hypothetical protein